MQDQSSTDKMSFNKARQKIHNRSLKIQILKDLTRTGSKILFFHCPVFCYKMLHEDLMIHKKMFCWKFEEALIISFFEMSIIHITKLLFV